MTYKLAIGDRTYSSWSLRGWLLFEKFDIPVQVKNARMYSANFTEMLAEFSPAKLVPAMKTPDGVTVQDTLAMAETLAERHPNAGYWPKGPAARAFARSIVAEMHAGFSALREECPMNLRRCYKGFTPNAAVLADIERLELLWSLAKNEFGGSGPWLFGDYCIADAFFAPVAMRLATYQLPVSDLANAYVNAHLADMSFRRWRAMGLAENYIQPGYDKELQETDWPGPKVTTTVAVNKGPSENTTCPYSGLPVTDYLEIEGRIFGFCNPFCRDKTIADPFAWPGFAEIYEN